MSEEYILVHDIGTTGDKACLFNMNGELVESQYRRYNTYHRHPHWVEQRPEEWWQAVCDTTPVLLKKAGISPSDVTGVTWSGHMLGCIPVDKNGNLLYEYVMIYVDSRARKEAKNFLDKLGGWETFYGITGFGYKIERDQVPKILWIKEHEPEVYNKTDKFLTTKDYLTMVLTGNKVCDYSDAFGLLDLRKDDWSNELLEVANIEIDKLPELCESTDIAGYVRSEAAEEMGLEEGTPVVVGSGDDPAIAMGAGLATKNDSFMKIGSTCELGYLAEKPVFNPEIRVSSLPHILPSKYLIMECMWDGGIDIDWLKDVFFWEETEKNEENKYGAIEREAKRIPPGSEGVLFLPYLRGGGAPYYNLNSKGAFLGLTLDHKRPHLIRSVYEGIALNARATYEVFERKLGIELDNIRIVGGGALSKFWRQVFADVLGKKIFCPELAQEATSLGSAIVGGIGLGLFTDFSVIDKMVKIKSINKPQTEAQAKYDRMYEDFEEYYNALFK